jgi:uncharacterized protein (UPF0548 family)
MNSLRRPSPSELEKLLRDWQADPLSYQHRKGVDSPPKAGFISEDHHAFLGIGREVYQRACKALDEWVMFPLWAEIHPPSSPQKPGQILASLMKIFGLWWLNPCRILKRYDSETRHGFDYGTLLEHSECGEERFMVEIRPDGTVWYEIRAFSRPQHWMTWIGFPLARWWQLRFVRDSKAAMQKYCA